MYDRFLKLLKEKNLTASKVAKATGINRSTFTHWKNGDFTPKVTTLQKIADYFKVPVSYFYGEDEQPSYYLDEETAKLAQELHDDPDLRAMFSTARNMPKEDVIAFKNLMEKYKSTNEYKE